MNRNNYRGSLSSHVEPDGCLESRIPTLGLHMDAVDGPSSKDVCISGPVDSGISSMGASICDSGFETSMDLAAQKFTQMSLQSQPEDQGSQEYTKDCMYDSVGPDGGYVSSEIHLSTEEFPTHSTKDQLSDEKLHQQEELLRLFSPDDEGDTQLHIAIIQGANVSFTLVNVAAEISPEILNIQNLLGQTPLHLAVLTKQNILLRHLVLKGAALDARDRNGNTALHLACRDGSLACIYALLNPLSAEEYREANVSCFANFPQDLNIKNYDGETCLHMAVSQGHADAIINLVSLAKADIDIRDGRSGRTVLHYAVEAGNINMVRFLLEHCQADVNAQTFDGATPLRLAVGRRHSCIETVLLQAGADPASLNSDLLKYEESEDEEMDDIRIGGRLVRELTA